MELREKNKKLYRVGVIDATNVPGFALFSTMVGFSTLAKDAGFDVWLSAITTLSVWGMPGQVALVSLFATGSPLIVIFFAVAFANMRMMLMVISGYNVLRLSSHNIAFWQKILLVHIMAITSWAQINSVKDKYPSNLLLSYYVGFSVTIYILGLSGTLVGYFIDYFVQTEVLRAIAFMTPLYILLLVISSQDYLNRSAVILGGIITPLIYPIFFELSILIGGFLGGSITLGLSYLGRK